MSDCKDDRGEIIVGSQAEGTIFLEDEECRPFSLSPYNAGNLVFCNCSGVRSVIPLTVPGANPDKGELPYTIPAADTANADEKWKSADVELKDVTTPAVAQVDTVTVGGADDGTYSISINGVTYSFVAVSKTADEIAQGLRDAINAGSEPVTASGAGAAVVLTADVPGVAFTTALVSNPNTNMVLVNTTANVEEVVGAFKVVVLSHKFEVIERNCPPTA